MASSNCTIDPNPDISGIGIRAAAYIQIILSFFQPLLFNGADAGGGLQQLYVDTLLPGCALLFSAIIQAKTFGLSVYHGIIVLNLSWINNTSALIFLEFTLIAQTQVDKGRDFRRRVGDMLVIFYGSLESLVQNPDAPGDFESLKVSIDRAKSALEDGAGSEGSKRVLEKVIQELELLDAYGNSLKESLAEPAQQEHRIREASEALKKLMERNRIQLSEYFGPLVDPSTTSSAFTAAMGKVKKLIAGGAQAAEEIQGDSGNTISLLLQNRRLAFLGSAKLTLLSVFGLWLWFKVDDFGPNHECDPFTNVSFILRATPISSPTLRTFWIVFYFIFSFPIANILLLVGLRFAVVYSSQKLMAHFRGHPQSTLTFDPRYVFILLAAVMQVCCIASTEITIMNSGHLLKPNEEEQWTFGQTLALGLTIMPLMQVARLI